MTCQYPIRRCLPEPGMEGCGAPAAWRSCTGDLLCDHHGRSQSSGVAFPARPLPTAAGHFAQLAQALRTDIDWQIEHCRSGGNGESPPESPLEALDNLVGMVNCYTGGGGTDELIAALKTAAAWMEAQWYDAQPTEEAPE